MKLVVARADLVGARAAGLWWRKEECDRVGEAKVKRGILVLERSEGSEVCIREWQMGRLPTLPEPTLF